MYKHLNLDLDLKPGNNNKVLIGLNLKGRNPSSRVCVRACGADGDASEAEQRGGALFIDCPLPILAPLSLASLPPLASVFAKASAAEKAIMPMHSFAMASTAQKVAVPAHGLPCILSCQRAVLSFVILLHSVCHRGVTAPKERKGRRKDEGKNKI